MIATLAISGLDRTTLGIFGYLLGSEHLIIPHWGSHRGSTLIPHCVRCLLIGADSTYRVLMGLIGGLIGDPLRYLIVCVSSSLPLLSVNQHNPDVIGTLVRCYSREQHDRGFCDFARLTTASLKNPCGGLRGHIEAGKSRATNG